MSAQRSAKVRPGSITAGVMYDVEYRCTTPGPEVEEGSFIGFWTGEIDTWGKHTWITDTWSGPDRSRIMYLFAREIVTATRQPGQRDYPKQLPPKVRIAISHHGSDCPLGAHRFQDNRCVVLVRVDRPGHPSEMWVCGDCAEGRITYGARQSQRKAIGADKPAVYGGGFWEKVVIPAIEQRGTEPGRRRSDFDVSWAGGRRWKAGR